MVKFTSAAIAAALVGVSSFHGVDAFAGLAKSKSLGSSLKMVSFMLLLVDIFSLDRFVPGGMGGILYEDPRGISTRSMNNPTLIFWQPI